MAEKRAQIGSRLTKNRGVGVPHEWHYGTKRLRRTENGLGSRHTSPLRPLITENPTEPAVSGGVSDMDRGGLRPPREVRRPPCANRDVTPATRGPRVTPSKTLGQQRMGGGGDAQGAGEDHGAQGHEAEAPLGDPPEERRPDALAHEGGGHQG
jgi:hypothetical protein